MYGVRLLWANLNKYASEPKCKQWCHDELAHSGDGVFTVSGTEFANISESESVEASKLNNIIIEYWFWTV